MLLPIQKAALGVFTKITQLQQEALWFELMDVLTGLLRPQQLEQVNNASTLPWTILTTPAVRHDACLLPAGGLLSLMLLQQCQLPAFLCLH